MIKKSVSPPNLKASSSIKMWLKKHKNISLYILIYTLIIIGVSIAGIYSNESTWAYILIQVLLLGLGTLHLLGMYHFLAWSNRESFWKELVFSLLLGAIGLIIFLLSSNIIDFSSLPYNYSWAFMLFLIPFFFFKTFDFWLKIPDKRFIRWYYPYEDEIPTIEEFSQDISLKIKKSIADEDYYKMDITVPLDKTLSQIMHYLFYYHNNDEDNDQYIEVAEDNDAVKLYAWLFSTRTVFFNRRKILDTSKTIEELGIKKDTILFADRIFYPENSI